MDKYTDEGTFYKLPITSNFPQGERLEILKSKSQIDLIGWNDEFRISIIPQNPSAIPDLEGRKDFKVEANRPLLTDRIEYKDGYITAFVEPKTENEFDIDFRLDSKPITNIFEYIIKGADEFNFFFQPALTQKEIDEGTFRPDNVIGSYAVYHQTKGNHRVGSTNYATGKAFHIYRPKVIDTLGKEEWVTLDYKNGVLSIIVPQAFLDTAIYPVKIDPTFGLTTNGATFNNIATNAGADFSTRAGNQITPSEAGTLNSITVWLATQSGDENIDIIAYLNEVDSIAAGSHGQIAASERLNLALNATATEYVFTAASEAFTSTNYILNALGNGADIVGASIAIYNNYDTTAVSYYREASSGAGAYAARKESPWTDTAEANRTYSIYATYTASGGEANPYIGNQFFQLLGIGK